MDFCIDDKCIYRRYKLSIYMNTLYRLVVKIVNHHIVTIPSDKQSMSVYLYLH